MSPPSYSHLSSYRIMYLFVFFDLPTKTKRERKAYTSFRRSLLYAGFQAFQYSVYTRYCASHDVADKYTRRIKAIAPAEGHISILRVTEAQMLQMTNLYLKEVPKPKPIQANRQLTLL